MCSDQDDTFLIVSHLWNRVAVRFHPFLNLQLLFFLHPLSWLGLPICKGSVGALADELVENVRYLGWFGGRLFGDFFVDFRLLISDAFINDLSFDWIRLYFWITGLLLLFLFARDFGRPSLFDRFWLQCDIFHDFLDISSRKRREMALLVFLGVLGWFWIDFSLCFTVDRRLLGASSDVCRLLHVILVHADPFKWSCLFHGSDLSLLRRLVIRFGFGLLRFLNCRPFARWISCLLLHFNCNLFCSLKIKPPI